MIRDLAGTVLAGVPTVAHPADRKSLVHVVIVLQRHPNCLRLLTHCVRRAASRAAWIAGKSKATKIPMMRSPQQLDEGECASSSKRRTIR